jgi:hypothetical protein
LPSQGAAESSVLEEDAQTLGDVSGNG